jgi:adenylate cyclase
MRPTRIRPNPSGKGSYEVSHGEVPPPIPIGESRPDNFLDSWKEIAAYLGREVRTVQRWEKKEGLPVHRQIHEKLSTVYAYKSEIDAWWRGRSAKLASKAENGELTEGPRIVSWPTRTQIPGAKPVTGNIKLAVLPFENLSDNPDQEYLSDGMTEELTTQFGGLDPAKMSVIARTSVMQFKATRITAREIGQLLGVDYLLAGSVRSAAGRIRISAQLIQASDQSHLWARNYDRNMGDLLTIENDIAYAIANEVQLKLSTQQRARLKETVAQDPDAQECYLKGRYYSVKENQAGLTLAISLYQQAIEKAAEYASPYAGLSAAYIRLGHWLALPPEQAFPRARAAALKALELDGLLSEAHAALADVSFLYDWDWGKAETGYQKALSFNPSSTQALRSYASFLLAMKRFTESTDLTERARQLDPASVYLNAFAAVQLYSTRQYATSIEAARKTLQMDPGYSTGHLFLGLNYEQTSLHDAAIEELREAVAAAGVRSYIAHVARALAVSGKKDEAEKILDELQEESRHSYVSPWLFALIYSGLGDKDHAFDCLGECYRKREHDLVYSNIWPQFDNLHSDPRWGSLVRRVGLSP